MASQRENWMAFFRLRLMNSVRVFFFFFGSRSLCPPLLRPEAYRQANEGARKGSSGNFVVGSRIEARRWDSGAFEAIEMLFKALKPKL
jgi:hypothetical protein